MSSSVCRKLYCVVLNRQSLILRDLKKQHVTNMMACNYCNVSLMKWLCTHILMDDFDITVLFVWFQYNTDNSLVSSPIEGFYIYYRPFHSSELFQNVTLLQPSVRTHLLKNLQPGTEYLIKMQSFNGAGNSPFSNKVAKKTKGGLFHSYCVINLSLIVAKAHS